MKVENDGHLATNPETETFQNPNDPRLDRVSPP